MTRTVHIVPHTHWDREWYQPFQTFRMQLVDLVDELLDLLETDPAYAHFMLDGQMAVIDDYLAIRPENEARLRRLAGTGRITMGPWYILMDEFLVSGETIVRNLEMGLARATAFGGAMPVGYLPDMFGHIAQMPQILRQFGLTDTVVWRGTPEAVAQRPSFEWVAPDGSAVQARYLPRGYGNGAYLPTDAKELVEQIDLFVQEAGSRAGGEDEPLLWMHGTDHLRPQPRLGRLVAEANDLQDRWHLRVGSLADYVAASRRTDLASWQGELRSGARSNLLMGVASNRTDVKQAAARVERGLERYAEPLSALFLPAERWPATFLAEAWRQVILNSAHDSICACSADDVVDAVTHRFAEADQIARGLTERALLGVSLAVGALDAASDTPPAPLDGLPPGAAAPLAVNTSARTRSGLIRFTLPLACATEGTQVLGESLAALPMETMPVRDALDFIDVVVNNLGDVWAIDLDVQDDGSIWALLRVDGRRFGLFDPTETRARFAALAATDPDAMVSVFYEGSAQRTVLARVVEVPGFGWRRWAPGPLDVAPVTAEGRRLTNGIVEVLVADDATFAVNGHGGLGRLVDGGDKGDTYNWCPPADDVVVDEPVHVAVSTGEAGPLRAQLFIDATYRWPERVAIEERVGSVDVVVRTTLELHAGEDLVRVHVAFDNTVRDHRLRAWFPLPDPTTSSAAECAFAIVERGLDAEGGPTEPALATYPSRRFVSAGGLTIAHEGLLEYELVDIRPDAAGTPRAGALALTLLRTSGLLSQAPMQTRPLPAGPLTPLEGPQMIGPVEARYAVHLGDRDPYAVTDDAYAPLLGVGGIDVHQPGQVSPDRGHATTRPALLRYATTEPDGSGRALTVSGAEVSAVRRTAAGLLEVRVFNPRTEATTVTVRGRRGWLVDLRGRPLEPFEETFPLRAAAIATVHLAD